MGPFLLQKIYPDSEAPPITILNGRLPLEMWPGPFRVSVDPARRVIELNLTGGGGILRLGPPRRAAKED